MKAEELRIGNWITVMGSLPCQVTAYHLYMMETYKPIDPETEADYEEMTEPIPLTEEWLNRFGFEKSFNVWRKGFGSYEDSFELYPSAIDGNGYSFGLFRYEKTDYFCWHIKHAHQLQNLWFSLTGSELELHPTLTGNDLLN